MSTRPDDMPDAGLSPEEAARRLREFGPNELGLTDGHGLMHVIADVVREPMFALLIGAAAIYAVLGDVHEAAALLGFVLIIMAVTVLQERRTDRALQALRELSAPHVHLRRAGVLLRLPSREVVPGDLMQIGEGDRIAADGRVLQAHELQVDESMMTGESEPVAKADGSRVLAGTLVVAGQALVRVEATGARTEYGHIGQSLQAVSAAPSPLREDVARLTRQLVGIGMALCVLLFALFWSLRGGWLDALLAGITLAMSVLPQEFPVILIVFLAMAARRLATHQVLVRRLESIETLGQVTVLATDKTGTLTENRMQVQVLMAGDARVDVAALGSSPLPEAVHALLEYAVLASEIDAHDPMEAAFHRLAAEKLAGSEHLHPRWALSREYERTPGLMAMSHLWRVDRDDGSAQIDHVAAKGAPEAIADLCHLPDAERTRMLADAAALADQGLRVLAVARARHATDQAWPEGQHDFDFDCLGLVGLADPLRADVPAAMQRCRDAGIRVLMITGDHPRTAQAIARQAGIDAHEVLTGDELERLSPQAQGERVGSVCVCARMKPHQKLALVQALQARGEVIAMTGDGVNDAPALKAAHVGVAMGRRGSDVAREAAALVLLHDDFGALVEAISRGRRTFDNLRRALVYTIAVHLPIVALVLLPVMMGLPLVLTPVHIAFLELVIDPACSLAFEAEEGDGDVMRRPPRSRQTSVMPARALWLAVWQGLSVTALVLGTYITMLRHGAWHAAAGTAAFAVLVAANAGLILPNRAIGRHWRGLWQGWPAASQRVLALTLLALGVFTAWPRLAGWVGLVPLPFTLWLACVAAGLVLVVPMWGLRRWWWRGQDGQGAQA